MRGRRTNTLYSAASITPQTQPHGKQYRLDADRCRPRCDLRLSCALQLRTCARLPICYERDALRQHTSTQLVCMKSGENFLSFSSLSFSQLHFLHHFLLWFIAIYHIIAGDLRYRVGCVCVVSLFVLLRTFVPPCIFTPSRKTEAFGIAAILRIRLPIFFG